MTTSRGENSRFFFVVGIRGIRRIIESLSRRFKWFVFSRFTSYHTVYSSLISGVSQHVKISRQLFLIAENEIIVLLRLLVFRQMKHADHPVGDRLNSTLSFSGTPSRNSISMSPSPSFCLTLIFFASNVLRYLCPALLCPAASLSCASMPQFSCASLSCAVLCPVLPLSCVDALLCPALLCPVLLCPVLLSCTYALHSSTLYFYVLYYVLAGAVHSLLILPYLEIPKMVSRPVDIFARYDVDSEVLPLCIETDVKSS